MHADEQYKLPSAFLPPQELWRYNPYREEPIPTPLDERGLVDVAKLIHQVKATIEPHYDWHSSFSDIHHLEWPDRWYENLSDGKVNPHQFRNLAISKIYIPRIFHNWVHRITEPPPPPDEEVMRYRIEAQHVAMVLFRTVKHSKTLARKRNLSDEQLEDLLTERFENFSTTFELAKQTPKPFQLLDFEEYELRDIYDMVHIGTELGKFAVAATMTRTIAQPLAA
jgi:hypothetical protein